MMNNVQYYIVGGSPGDEHAGSERDLMLRLKAKANSRAIGESLTLKFKEGITREINGTLSDMLMVDMLNEDIRKDNVALMAILATKSTDDMAEEL
jgi:hypothetical protein